MDDDEHYVVDVPRVFLMPLYQLLSWGGGGGGDLFIATL